MTRNSEHTLLHAWRRRLRAVRAVAGVLAMVAVIAVWLAMPPSWRIARALTRVVWRCLVGGFGIEVRVHGAPAQGGGVLYVANHVSWTDIVVLAHVLGAGFVAKSDVAGWPLIGRAARHYGCVFIKRDRRETVAGQAADIAARFQAGDSLVLFAEGTTGDGSTVLPFKSSLFAAVGGSADRVVQPITLLWRNRDGTPFDAVQRRRFAWIDDDELLPNARALALFGGARVDIHFEPAMTGGDRKQLAAGCREAIAARLAADQAATLNRAA